jgi:hypothetical protein
VKKTEYLFGNWPLIIFYIVMFIVPAFIVVVLISDLGMKYLAEAICKAFSCAVTTS